MRITGDGGIGGGGGYRIHDFSGDVKAERLTVSLDAQIAGNIDSKGNVTGLALGSSEIQIFRSATDTSVIGNITAPAATQVILTVGVGTDTEFRFNSPGTLQMVYDAGVGEAGNIQFFDSVPTRLGYVGFAANDDMRIWAENTGGAVLFATQNTTRGSIAADGSWTFGSSSAPQAVSHAFYNNEDAVPCVVILNRAATATTGVGRGMDIYMGVVGSTNNPQTNDTWVRFRRGDGTVLGELRGDSGGVLLWSASDQKLKADISKDLAEGAAAFDAIPWRSFTWKGNGVRGHGVIAQQVADVPEWSHTVTKGGMFTEKDPETGKKRRYRKHWGVDYLSFIGAMGAKLVEVDRRLKELEKA